MASVQTQQLPASAAPCTFQSPPLRRPAPTNLYGQQKQQKHQYDKAIMTTDTLPSAPTGAGGLAAVPAVPPAPAPAAAATAIPTSGPIHRYRKRKSKSGAATAPTDPEQEKELEQGPPLLFSKVAGQVYMLLDSIVGMEAVKTHVQVLLAAPIVVLSRKMAAAAAAAAGGGSGGSADVLFRPHPTKRVVVKRIDLSWVRALRAEEARGGPVGEAAALAILGRSPSHPNVMPLIDSFADAASDSLYLVMPHADGGELFALAAESGTGLPEEEARKYLTQIVAGLLHLKSHGLAHGDVSLENIMLQKEKEDSAAAATAAAGRPSYTCRLIDFGLARRTPEPEGAVPAEGRLLGGKGAYVAPEVVDATVRDWHAADVWSLGVCLYNLLTGLTLYSHPRDPAFRVLATERHGARRLLRHHIQNYAVHLDPAAAHLIAWMLNPAPARRPTYEQILNHPWARGVEEWQWDGVASLW